MLLGSCAVLGGCAAGRAPVASSGEGVSGDGTTAGERVCRVVEGSPDAPWRSGDTDRSWTRAGSYFAVRRSDVGSEAPGDEAAGRNARADDARRSVVSRAYAFAFEKLASRGVSFADRQVVNMVDERTEAFIRGEDAEFPRIRIDDVVVEACEGRAPGDWTYRAAALVEYPIAHLRGDVNNARWHAGRAGNEAGVLFSSARSLFSDGRWLDALLELERARDLLGTACDLPENRGLADRIDSLMDWARLSLTVEPVDGVQVMDVGERRAVSVGFRWSYEWEGRKVMAARLPVSFRPHGFQAVFASDSETDETGVAVCRVVVAYGRPGECAIEPRLDLGVIGEALGQDYAGQVEPYTGPLHKVFLVEGAHALSVCVEIVGLEASDDAQILTGFTRRMELDGYRVLECGADVDVVVSVDAVLRSSQVDDGWKATVSLSGSAFDQRSAQQIGRPSILVEESAAQGVRESEVVALKEAGRLLAAYLSHRILMTGE